MCTIQTSFSCGSILKSQRNCFVLSFSSEPFSFSKDSNWIVFDSETSSQYNFSLSDFSNRSISIPKIKHFKFQYLHQPYLVTDCGSFAASSTFYKYYLDL